MKTKLAKKVSYLIELILVTKLKKDLLQCKIAKIMTALLVNWVALTNLWQQKFSQGCLWKWKLS